MPHLDGVRQIFDFHDMGLFLEVKCPGSSQPSVVQCSRPGSSNVTPVVQVDKIQPGEVLKIDMGEDFSKPRTILLTKRSNNGVLHWWECCWNN